MRSGQDSEEQYMPDSELIKSWKEELELEDFNERVDLKPMSGFHSSSEPHIFFASLWSHVEKLREQSKKDLEAEESAE